MNVSSTTPRSPATSANRYEGFTKGSFHTVKCLLSSPETAPLSTKLPLERSTGYFFLSASMRVVKTDMTSGLSWKNVMRRNPSASHCVQKFPLDLYRPSSSVFSCGLISVTTRSSNATDGGDSTVRPLFVSS